MAYKTISYSETSEGFPSFYSFQPEWMIGMNNYFYSFNKGNLWRHNADSVNRCNFYGVDNSFSITSVFNQLPVVSKIFKTINLESTVPFSVSCSTDIGNEQNITVTSDEFVQKEGAYFAYLRYTSMTNPVVTTVYPLRYVNGIGKTDITITGPANASVVEFPAGVEVNSILSVGDSFYFSLVATAYATLEFMGTVTAINRANRQVTVDATAGTVPALAPGVTNAFFVYIKNRQAESYGALGHYMNFVLTSSSTSAAELFAVETEYMPSSP
ncbi:MAG: putative structural protein [Prokaryotic dsDNA virus sp.]|nr:MAG: putative structural protein [Prokaryotic dsDNA virus sp.]|tara:strand:- start:47810 stop:48619 length:810 start_codon:yes stop_codon:yes gene_type:complete